MMPVFSPLARCTSARRRPAFDRLERRLALSFGGDGSIVDQVAPPDGEPADPGGLVTTSVLTAELVSPAPSSTLYSPPGEVIVAFSHPVLPDTIYEDVVIYRVAPGGEIEWATTPSVLTPDDSATRLNVQVADPLVPGSYQVWIVGYTSIMDQDGVSLTPDGEPLILGGFEIAQPGVTLGQATDLGTIGEAPREVPGNLDFSTDPRAVSLYRLELDPGQFWRLGLEITAQRDGSSLHSALSLFDSEGRVIGGNDLGRFGFPRDAFLFRGLEPGTYYVGVSGFGNLAGSPGGYDPVTGSPGSIEQTQPGGDFRLHLVADPVDSPATVVRFGLDRADTRDPRPTGLSLGFSRAIAVPDARADLGRTLAGSIVVVDGQGTSWKVVMSVFDESQAQISYVFDRTLPAGHYQVRLPDQGGLVDLAGLAPVASGQPDGVLGQFDVTATPVPREPHDLGAMLPEEAAQGLRTELALAPGQSTSYRFITTIGGVYAFAQQAWPGPVSVEIASPAGSYGLLPQPRNDVELERGEHFLTLSNPGSETINVSFSFGLCRSGMGEILLSNGIGQTPALSLRLISFPSEATIPLPPGLPDEAAGPLPPLSPGGPGKGPPDSPEDPDAAAGGSEDLARGDSAASAPYLGTSHVGWGTDLVGRPIAFGSGAQSHLAAGAIATTGGLRAGHSTRLSSPPASIAFRRGQASPILDQVPASIPARAAMLELDLKQAVAAAVRFQQWAVDQGTLVSRWVGSWWERAAGWIDPGPAEPGSARDTSVVWGSLDPEEYPHLPADKPPETSVSTTGFLTPPFIVLSVAAVSQIGWHALRWWRSRKLVRKQRDPRAGVEAVVRVSLGRFGLRRSTSAIGLSLFRRSGEP